MITVYALLRLQHDTIYDVPWAQQEDGAAMPLLSYSFRTHREYQWWAIPEQARKYDHRSTTRSLSAMTDATEDGRAEWQHCSDPQNVCEGADKSGASVSFPRGRMNLQNNQVVGLQFPLAGIRAAMELKEAHLAFEMYGEKELFPTVNPEQRAPLTVEIQVELSTHSLPLQDQERDITSRELTNWTVFWQVPPQQKHKMVETPDLSPLLTKLTQMTGWTEESSVTLTLTPTNGTGWRVFKSRDKRTGANMHLRFELLSLAM